MGHEQGREVMHLSSLIHMCALGMEGIKWDVACGWAERQHRKVKDREATWDRDILIPVGAPPLVCIPFYPSIVYLVWLETMVAGSLEKRLKC